MDYSPSTLERLAEEISLVFLPLLELELYDAEELQGFLEELGWLVPESVADIGIDSELFEAVSDAIEAVGDLYYETPDAETAQDKYIELAAAVLPLAIHVADVAANIRDHLDATYLAGTDIAAALPKRLLDYLIIDYIQNNYNALYHALVVLGCIELQDVPRDDAAHISKHTRRILHWDRIIQVITDPGRLFRAVYQWGTPEADLGLLIERLYDFFLALGLPAGLEYPVMEKQATLWAPLPVPEEDEGGDPELRVPIFRTNVQGLEAEFGITFYPLPPPGAGGTPGLAMTLYTSGAIAASIPLGEQGLWVLEVDADLDLSSGVGIVIRPDSGPTILTDLLRAGTQAEGSINMRIQRQAPPNEDLILFGISGGTGLKTKKFFFGGGTTGKDVFLETGLEGGSIVIQASEGDGFLQKILPQDPVRINFDLILGWSIQKGFYIKGGAGFEYTFQINKSLGPIFINSINLRLDPSQDNLTLITAVTGGAQIGPVTAVVHEIGLKTIVQFDKPGLLGNMDLDFGFKLPSLIGLSVEAASISGGGAVLIDPPNYGGILQLSFQDEIAITAFALITTKLPDGRNGFSMVIEILAEFQPIQLSMGFALIGVGGLIGINRQMNEEGLREVVKNHSLDAILFPPSPIKDAVKIFETVGLILWIREDYHVFGLMAKLLWGGSVELVQFQIGIFIEIGGPIRIAILGLAKAELPDKEEPVLRLKMDLLGFIDFGNETVAIDSSLFDSTLLKKYILSGQMALRSNWGDNPDFVLSVGGFNPRFTPPPGFPSLQRLMISLGSGNPRISLANYMAITTNTLQFGALLDLYAEKAGFTIVGGMGFDALFIFNPFSFEVFIGAWVAVKKGSKELLSASLGFNFTGLNPFHAIGYAEFKILFVKVKVKFDKTFGDPIPQAPAVVSPLQVLIAQLQDDRNIRFSLPDWASASLIFTKEAETRLDPVGEVVISQNAVPLDFAMDTFGGGVPPEDEKILSITAGHEDIETDVTTRFAPAQFKNISDDEKLSALPYELFKSGKGLRGEFVTVSRDRLRTTDIEFETVLRESEDYLSHLDDADAKNKPYRLLKDKFSLTAGNRGAQLFRAWSLAGSGNYFNSLRKVRDRKKPGFIQVLETSFSVTGQGAVDGKFARKTFNDAPVGNMTYAEAFDVMKGSKDKDAVIRDTTFVAAGE